VFKIQHLEISKLPPHVTATDGAVTRLPGLKKKVFSDDFWQFEQFKYWQRCLFFFLFWANTGFQLLYRLLFLSKTL